MTRRAPTYAVHSRFIELGSGKQMGNLSSKSQFFLLIAVPPSDIEIPLGTTMGIRPFRGLRVTREVIHPAICTTECEPIRMRLASGARVVMWRRQMGLVCLNARVGDNI